MPQLKVMRAVLMAAAFAACASSQPNTLTPEEKSAGWTLLFDGTTMHGWNDTRLKAPLSNAWMVEDGCLKAQAKPQGLKFKKEGPINDASASRFNRNAPKNVDPRTALKLTIHTELIKALDLKKNITDTQGDPAKEAEPAARVATSSRGPGP